MSYDVGKSQCQTERYYSGNGKLAQNKGQVHSANSILVQLMKDNVINNCLELLAYKHTFSSECFNHQSGDIIVSPQTIFV